MEIAREHSLTSVSVERVEQELDKLKSLGVDLIYINDDSFLAKKRRVHEILDRLTTDGFLVLRVDDRGAGASSAPPDNMSYLDLVADARACVAFLAQRDDVDPTRIALIGHSEGGETAPLLALEALPIAAVVLMAAPGRPLLEIMTDQNRAALEAGGLSGAELEAELAKVVDLLKRLCGSGPIDPDELPADQRSILANRAWLQTHAQQDPLATIRAVRCPVLVLQGAKDFQVSLERDARALDAALTAAAHPDHELRVFAELDHLFKKSPGLKSILADYAEDRRVDAEFLDVLSTWLRKHLMPQPR
jgi:pimeloyl-ACP methyl ester carboxylesterase